MNFQAQAREVIEIELAAIKALHGCIDHSFDRACEALQGCTGRIVVLGMGKSGHIGHKIAATLASTGSPAFAVHAGEASHGDLGMITPKDVVLVISFSGNTPEVVSLLPKLKELGVTTISITGNPQSKIAQLTDIHLRIQVEREACPLNLAPTASTTATLVMGDALAVALLKARGFTEQDFAFSHPGGNLGKQLLLKTQNLMHVGPALPCVPATATLAETLAESSRKRLGMAIIVDEQHHLLGIFTDGDLRRCYQQSALQPTTPIATLMTRNPKVAHENDQISTTLELMERHKITALVVVDQHHCVQGLLHMHDILQAVIED